MRKTAILKKSKINLQLSKEFTIDDSSENTIFLSAISRKGNISSLNNLIAQGLVVENSFIKTDLKCRTTLPNVYAVGDVNGKIMLAHVASTEGSYVIDTILGNEKDIPYDMMPFNLYASIEFASIGLSEDKAKEQGFLVETGKFPLSANGKALADGNSDGFVKVIYEKKYGEILGVHIVAPNATDLIGEASLGMRLESTIWDWENHYI